MIEPFSTEQYLPCSESELFGVDRRRGLPELAVSISLDHDVRLLPMYRGGMLVTAQGLFYADDDMVALVRELAHNPSATDVMADASKLQELERLHHYGLLAFDNAPGGRVVGRDVPDAIRELYAGNDYGWFFYYPTKIELDLSNLCNFECVHCSKEASPHVAVGRELDFGEIKAIIAEAARLGVDALMLMGGEPLVYRHFFEICEYAKAEGIRRLETSSNGWVVDRDLAQKLAPYFDEIQLSLHGALESTHDAIAKKQGSWKRTTTAAKVLADAGIQVRLSFTVMEQNAGEIELMANVARDIGAAALRFLALSNRGRGKHLKGWTYEERNAIGARIRTLRVQAEESSSGLEVECGGFPPPAPLNTSALFYGCPAGRELLYISAEGLVSCCGVVEEFIGSIREHSIEQFWHHPKMIGLRTSRPCNCDYRCICAGPCIADFDKPYEDKPRFL